MVPACAQELVAELGGVGAAKLVPIQVFAAAYRQRFAAAPAVPVHNSTAAMPAAA